MIDPLLLALAASGATAIGALPALYISESGGARRLALAEALAGGVMLYMGLAELFHEAYGHLLEILSSGSSYAVTTSGVILGWVIAIGLDNIADKLYEDAEKKSNKAARRAVVLMVAISAHNIPEGFATFMSGSDDPRLGIAMALAIGIHNIPEGFAVALPVRIATKSRVNAFIAASLSGLCEFIGALLAWGLYSVFGFSTSDWMFGVIYSILSGIMAHVGLIQLLGNALIEGKYPGRTVVFAFICGCVIASLGTAALRFIDI